MVQYDNLIMPDKAKSAAQLLNQYCSQTGCMYCCFRIRTKSNADLCGLYHTVPREWPMPEILEGGKHNA